MTLLKRAVAFRCWVLVGLAVGVSGKGLAAQQVVVGPRALGTATTGAAFASGVQALGSTPGRLAWNAGARTELVLLSGGVRLGLRPVTPRDVARYSGQVLDAQVREEWLVEVERNGSEEGATVGVFTPFAMARGRFAMQITTTAQLAAALNPDAVEALLFGNLGRTGSPATLDFSGSTAEGWSMTTVALAGGFAVHRLGRMTRGDFALGATAKLSVGHVLWSAIDGGSGSLTDPLSLEGVLPVVAAPLGTSRGLGVGLDAGAAWKNTEWNVDFLVRDALNTFNWDKGDLEFRRGVLGINPDSTFESSERFPVELAPLALRDRVEEFGFTPSASLTIARRLSNDWHIAFEGTCGPAPLTATQSTTIDRSDVGRSRCRGGSAVQKQWGGITLRGGVALGSRGTDLGAGLSWRGARGRVEAAYGRRFGGLSASGLALAWGLFLGE